MANMNDRMFSRMFRMDRESFKTLFPLLKRVEVKASNSSGSPILPVTNAVTKLAATIRFLAGKLLECALFGLNLSTSFMDVILIVDLQCYRPKPPALRYEFLVDYK